MLMSRYPTTLIAKSLNLTAMKTNAILNMDCLTGLRELPDNSVDLVVTSPPYDNLRTYHTDGFKWDFEVFKPIAQELYRVLKPGCVIVWVVGDATINGTETGSSFCQALYFKGLGLNLHDTMIYEKNGSTYPASTLYPRYTQMFEYMFVFSKGKIRKDIQLLADRRNKWAGCESWGANSHYDKMGNLVRQPKAKPAGEYSLRGNIWRYVVTMNDKTGHPAVFPEKLAEDHILSWSVKGDLVVDPFAGSGTTCKMAVLHGRNYLGFETNQDYCRMANERVAKYEGQERHIQSDGSIQIVELPVAKDEIDREKERQAKAELWRRCTEELEVLFNENSISTISCLKFSFSNKKQK